MIRRPIVAAALVAAAVATATGAASAATATVTRPASAASGLGPVQWAFTALGAPSKSRAGVRTSWFRGNGTWNGGAAKGTIRVDDSGGGPKSRIVLSVSGVSKLSPGITKFGLKGVQIAIPVKVSATNDASCVKGTKGTVTLFASYYSIHEDSLVAHFAAPCADHDLTFTGPVVKGEIQRNGAQVNST